MTSNHVVPTLQASVVCEDVRQEVNGIQSLIGVLTVVPAANAPVGILKIAIWTRWSNGLGKFQQTARILAPDNVTVIGDATVDFEIKNIASNATNVNFFAGVQFPSFGIYTVEVALDGNVAIRYPLIVAQMQQQPQAPAGN